MLLKRYVGYITHKQMYRRLVGRSLQLLCLLQVNTRQSICCQDVAMFNSIINLYSLMQTQESLGEFESLCEPESQAKIYISTYSFKFEPNSLSSVCRRLCIYKHRVSIFYFFYKIRLKYVVISQTCSHGLI